MLEIKRLHTAPASAAGISEIMDCEGIAPVILGCTNWADRFPYAPQVSVRIAHTGDAVALDWTVDERYVRAAASADGGKVWEDSCVEFFMSPEGTDYINVECNCAGRVLCGVGPGREWRFRHAPEALAAISRHASLAGEPFDTREASAPWRLSVLIPSSFFFSGESRDLSGLDATANFYKCGDRLPQPHFLSWQPVGTENPDFHRPEFFGKIHFE